MELQDHYNNRKDVIKQRIRDFEAMRGKSDEEIFEELVFCLMTPQSKARTCDKAVKKLKEKSLLFRASEENLKLWMAGVRFPNEKARHIAEAQRFFSNGTNVRIKDKLEGNNREVREWFVKNVKGLGYKEASHFLRNVGVGLDLAIIDRHILKNLVRYGVIEEIPKSLTPKKYFEIEGKMKQFSDQVGISMAELDLLFWSMETGEVFK